MLVLMINIHDRVWQWVRKNVVQVIHSSRFNGHHEKSLRKVKPTNLRLILSERERYVVRIIIKSINIFSKGQPS